MQEKKHTTHYCYAEIQDDEVCHLQSNNTPTSTVSCIQFTVQAKNIKVFTGHYNRV